MIRKLVKDILRAIRDPEREFLERTFLAFAFFSEAVTILALIGDIYVRESIIEILTLSGVAILVPLVSIIGLYRNRIIVAARILITGTVVVVLPILFFFGGGLRGGGFIWVIFAFMFVGLVLTGTWKKVLTFILFAESIGCYLGAYYYPQYVYPHSKTVQSIDSFISLMLVGLVCSVMTWFQARLFREENRRAQKEAERAEELTRAQNRFFSSMSHEIRTPINSILGLNELILRDQSASDEIIKDATGIQGAGKMLLALINDILDFSKMEAGSMDIVPVDYHVGDLLSEIVNMVWLRAHDKGLDFNVSVDPEVPSVLYGDEVRIKQVIINLLNNAVKYTQEGSVSLHVESEDLEGGKVLLRINVSDTGIGIKKEALPFLFDAFKRVDEEKNRHIEGTGLGLSIVREIVSLMDGNVTVNSVYGEGSMFTVELTQRISERKGIGELNIHNQATGKREAYTSSFRAPDARILIVDDNEMNLEVECKLLAATEMTIDKAMSGRDALDQTLAKKYDTILMDHLMPEMDGIQCLERIRNQEGGLNRNTPVVVLTANAGSTNKELYNRAGFDGYLVKPVSGDALESMLIKHIAGEKLVIRDTKMTGESSDINTLSGYSGKAPVVITTSSMSDLPEEIVRRINLPIIPCHILTAEGDFKDGEQMGADELIRYIGQGKEATSWPPTEAEYTEFFSSVLRRAHHVIHISLTTSMSVEYKRASEAAKSFGNVTVINSGCLSSATGILALIAYKLSQQNIPVEDIVKELETIKERLRCSFVIDTTEYMARRGLITKRLHRMAGNLSLHPAIRFRDDKSGVGFVWSGSTKRAYKKYINWAFPVDIIPDSDVVFITYVDIPHDTLMWIKEEISKVAYFEHVVFKQASAAISSNCGPGTFGILYFVKSNKSYNIGSYVADAEAAEKEAALLADTVAKEEPVLQEADRSSDGTVSSGESDTKWYHSIEGIDGETAIKNSGSEDAFKSVLQIFYDSIPAKSAEIGKYYADSDWPDYTIKVHALKSSARLIGATDLADRAQLLENAGKESDADYIRTNHDAFMQDYLAYGEYLKGVCGKEEDAAGDSGAKPVAGDEIMQGVYAGLKEAADAMDCATMEEIFDEMKDYSIPEGEKDKYEALREAAGNYDYDGILELLRNE